MLHQRPCIFIYFHPNDLLVVISCTETDFTTLRVLVLGESNSEVMEKCKQEFFGMASIHLTTFDTLQGIEGILSCKFCKHLVDSQG